MSKVKFNYASVTADKVDEFIASAVDSVNTMHKKVQYAAYAVLLHTKKHGDYSKANTLIKALGSGVRHKALVEYFVKFGGLILNTEQPANGFNGWSGKEAINLDGAKEKPWWELKPEPKFAGVDLDSLLSKLIARCESAVEEAANDPEKADKVKVDPETLVKLKAVAGL